MTPVERVAAASDRWGDGEVVLRCIRLLGQPPGAVPKGGELELALVLGGLRDRDWFAGGKPPGHRYWARVWAARAMRYVWDDSAAPTVLAALGDEHWRVREMAAKVVGDREIGEAADRLRLLLVGDDVPGSTPPRPAHLASSARASTATRYERRRQTPTARSPGRPRPRSGRSLTGSIARCEITSMTHGHTGRTRNYLHTQLYAVLGAPFRRGPRRSVASLGVGLVGLLSGCWSGLDGQVTGVGGERSTMSSTSRAVSPVPGTGNRRRG